MTVNKPQSMRLALFGLIAVALAACATTVAVKARFPARNPAAADLRKTAIGVFMGPGGQEFASALEAEITSAQFDDAAYFTVVDGGKHQGRADAQAAVEYGHRVGAQGIFFGQVAPATVQNEAFQGLGNRCVASNAYGCLKWALVPVGCTRHTVSLEVNPFLVKVASGQVVYSGRKVGSANTSWCQGELSPASDDMLVTAARNQIIAQIRLDVAPYNQVLQASIKENGSGLSNEASTLFDAAVASAKKADMGEACRQWGEVDKASPNHIWTVYDLGVCAETNADYAKALALYERSRSLSPKADNDITASIARVQRLADANKGVVQMEQRRANEVAETRRQAAEQDRQKQVQIKAAKSAQDAKHAQLVAAYGAQTATLIEAGQVRLGMSMAAVRAAKGEPGQVVKVPGGDELWRYGPDAITFSKGKVAFVGH